MVIAARGTRASSAAERKEEAAVILQLEFLLQILPPSPHSEVINHSHSAAQMAWRDPLQRAREQVNSEDGGRAPVLLYLLQK